MTEPILSLADFLWGVPLQSILITAGVYFTLSLKFIQIRTFPAMIRHLFSGEKNDGISAFAAMTAALGGTIGVGNIVGVTAALSMGGPGALFWMVVSGFLGMATKYAEVASAVSLRRKTSNGYLGGAMICLQDHLHAPFLATVFAVLCIASSFGVGNLLQSFTAAAALTNITPLSPWQAGLLMAAVLYWSMRKGAAGITSLTKWLVPVMAVLYTAACLWLIWLRRDQIGSVVEEVFTCAFSFPSSASGVMGYGISAALRAGLSRGVFSNEAGMGSSPIAHALSEKADPYTQGLMGMAEVFFDTVFMCTLTGITALLWGGWSTNEGSIDAMVGAFTAGFGTFGGTLLQISLALFALTSVWGWAVYGERCICFLSGDPFWQKVYRISMAGCCLVGSLGEPTLAWALADCFNGLMALPNIWVLVSLRKKIKYTEKEHLS